MRVCNAKICSSRNMFQLHPTYVTHRRLQGDMRLVHEATGCTGIMYPQSQMILSFDTSSPSESHGDECRYVNIDDLISKYDSL